MSLSSINLQLQPHPSDPKMLQLMDPTTSERQGGIFKKRGILSEKVSGEFIIGVPFVYEECL